MLTKFNCFRNSSCFCLEKCLIKLFADISMIGIQITFISSDCISWHSQCWCTSTWRSLISSFMIFLIKIRIVWRLSHWIFNVLSISNLIDSKKRLHQIVFLIVWEIASNFASMLDVMIVICLTARQFMIFSYSWKKKPSEFWQITSSFSKAASLAQMKMLKVEVPYSMTKCLVQWRYEITQLTAAILSLLKFFKNWNNQNEV